MKIIVVGCGRVGAELALTLQAEHEVAVVDSRPEAFDRLGHAFAGRSVQGDGMDREALVRAGIETADALAAVTASDNVNAIVARIASAIFHVPRVAARLYNPHRAPVYEKLGIQTVSSSTWGAQRLTELLARPDLAPQSSNGRWVWQPDGR